MSPTPGARRPSTARLRRGLLLTVATAGSCAAMASVAHADTLNVITQASNSVASASQPIDALPATSDQTTPGGTQYTAPTSTSTTPPAGGDDDYTESFSFGYGGTPSSNSTDGNADETVQTLDLNLPPGLLDSLAAANDLCTPAELGTMPTETQPGTGWLGGAPGNAGCPAASRIGEVAGTVESLGLQVPVSGNLFIERAASADDVAQVGVEVEADLFGSWYRAQVASGPIRFVTAADGNPALQVALTLPGGSALTGSTNAASAGNQLPYTLETLTQTINGLTPDGTPFQRFPTSDAPAGGTAAVTVQDNGSNGTTQGATAPGVGGSGSVSITPTGAGSLPYAPQLSADVVRDPGDFDAALSTTVTQASDEAASHRIELTLPASLQPNLTNALTDLCADPDATASGCTPVGTVTADSPLLPTPLTGSVYLTGTSAGPALTLVFPPPVALVLTGSVDLGARTVTFASVPDMPVSRLSVDIAGGPSGIYETTCTAGDDAASVLGAFTGQNGATSTSTGAFSVAGCPAAAPAPTSATPPPASLTGTPSVRAWVRHLTRRAGRMIVQVRRTGGSATFAAATITPPAGLRFSSSNLRYAVSVIGAKVTGATLSHGRLHVVTSAPSRSLYVTIHRAALQESAGLERRLAAHRVHSERFRVDLETPGLQARTVLVSASF